MARIRHIAIQTQDEEATKDFYVKNLGLEVVQKLWPAPRSDTKDYVRIRPLVASVWAGRSAA